MKGDFMSEGLFRLDIFEDEDDILDDNVESDDDVSISVPAGDSETLNPAIDDCTAE
jgi:hypothetical protein